MVEYEKERGFIGMIKDGLSYIPQIISASISQPIAEGAEIVMKTVEGRIMRMEKRILRMMCSLLIIWSGGLFLIFALFFFLREFLGWNNTASFFSIGMPVFVIGLLLKIGNPKR